MFYKMKRGILILVIMSSVQMTHVYAYAMGNSELTELLESRRKIQEISLTEGGDGVGGGSNSSDGIGGGSNSSNGIGGGSNSSDGIGDGSNSSNGIGGGRNSSDGIGGGSNNSDGIGSGSNSSDGIGGGSNSSNGIGSGVIDVDGIGGGSNSSDDVNESTSQFGYDCHSCSNTLASADGADKDNCVEVAEGSTTKCWPDLHGEPLERGCNVIAGYLKPDTSEPVQFVFRTCDNIPKEVTPQEKCDDMSKVPNFVQREMSIGSNGKESYYVRDCYCTTPLCNSVSMNQKETTTPSYSEGSGDYKEIMDAVKDLKKHQQEKVKEISSMVDNVHKNVETINEKITAMDNRLDTVEASVGKGNGTNSVIRGFGE